MLFMGISMMLLSMTTTIALVPPLAMSHTCLKTSNIIKSIDFFSLFGFEIQTKFRAGPARAALLASSLTELMVIELIEVPNQFLPQMVSPDFHCNQALLGFNHICFDVSSKCTSLADHLNALQTSSLSKFGRPLVVVVEPRKQIVGKHCFELSMLRGVDGILIELIRFDKVLEIEYGLNAW